MNKREKGDHMTANSLLLYLKGIIHFRWTLAMCYIKFKNFEYYSIDYFSYTNIG